MRDLLAATLAFSQSFRWRGRMKDRVFLFVLADEMERREPTVCLFLFGSVFG